MSKDNIQTRDEIAGVLGWTLTRKGEDTWRHKDYTRPWMLHPVPDSLDAIAALWSENLAGWSWWRMRGYWFAFRPDANPSFVVDQSPQRVKDTGDELADRLALLLMALKVEKKQ